MTNTAKTPLEIDTQLAGLYELTDRLSRQNGSCLNLLHRAVGDGKAYHGSRQSWGMSHDAVIDTAKAMVAEGRDRNLTIGFGKIARTLAEMARLDEERQAAESEIAALDAIYRHDPWARYFPCTNSDGHIHATFRGCPTVRFDTSMAWRPGLSGKTVEEAIDELKETLCSVCFPGAPVEYRERAEAASKAERDARAAERDARAEAKYVKQLREEEQFRDGERGGWVTTVHGCKEAIRRMAEMLYYYGTGPHPYYPGTVPVAKKAADVLVARGSATQAEVDALRERALVGKRKEAVKSFVDHKGMTRAQAEEAVREIERQAAALLG
jgi:hypothetical protein